MATIANQFNENHYFSNISADTATFNLGGGLYGVLANATWGGGSVTLQRLSLDTTTWITVLTAFSASGYQTVSIPPGSYRFTVASATAIYVEIIRIARTA